MQVRADGTAVAVTPGTMRTAMGAFSTGVVVVTALDDRAGAQPLGMTCQSLVSLSLAPPLISISPARSSSSWPRIRAVRRFAVNVLAHDQADVSERFARSGGNKYDGIGWRVSAQGSPLLDGVSAWAECTLWREYDGGDHTIAVGRVTAVGHDPERAPLVYYRGSYRRLDGAGG